jgi:hypothetical protein
MVYVVSRWWFPTHKQEEVANIFQKTVAEGRPESVGEVVVFASKGSKKGAVGMSFRRVAPDKIAEGMTEAITILQNYDKVEGYEYNVEIWADLTEVPEES